MSDKIVKIMDFLISTIAGAMAAYLIFCIIYWEFLHLTDAGIRGFLIISAAVQLFFDKKK